MSNQFALIIDYDGESASVLAEMLSWQGIDSTPIFDPRFLDRTLAEIIRPEVIFLELHMPLLDGYLICGRLQRDSRFQGVPIVAYTYDYESMDAAYQAGFYSFLGKPLDSEHFPHQLASILNGEGIWHNG